MRDNSFPSLQRISEKGTFFFLRNGTLLAPLRGRKPDYGTRKLTAAEPDRMRHESNLKNV